MNALAPFQWFTENCLEDLCDDICIPNLDDIIVFSQSFTEHLEHLRTVLRHLCNHGVKLKLKKCNLFANEVCYLGHIVTKDGYCMDPSNADAVQSLKGNPPRTIGSLRKMLGFLSYYRRYIKDFAKITHSLYSLLSLPDAGERNNERGDKAKRKQSRRQNKRRNGQLASSVPIEWDQIHQQAVETLVDCFTTPPILAYPDYEKDFILHVDASEKGLGAVLYQEQEKVLRVIGYGSRILSPAEKKSYLHSRKLEFMALRWVVTEQFRDFLYYAPHFHVYTDNNPLTYVQSSAKLNAAGLRLVGELADYHFSIHYRPGKAHIDADTMSRLPFEEFMKHCTVKTTPDAIKATFSMIQAQADGELIWVSGISSEPVDYPMKSVHSPLTPADIKQAQEKDPGISVILEKKGQTRVFRQMKRKLSRLLHVIC